MKSLSLEIRVGFLVIISLALLVAFIFVFGGIDFSEGHTIYVDFNNPGNVKPGAAVAIGSVRVGSVEEIEYRGGALDPQTGRRPLIRIRISVDPEVRSTIHDDALFYVTSQGLLGESIIAIDPGSYDRPVIAENAIVQGVDPPRLDLALALGYELLDNIVGIIRSNRDGLQDLLGNIGSIVRALNEIVTEHRDRIDRIIENVETATAEASQLLSSARGTIDGPEVQRTIRNLDRTLAAVARDIDPLMHDAREAAHNANETLASIGPEQRTQLQDTMENASELVADAQAIVSNIRQGNGTVGALLMDEEVYDDIQEMLRDLKHNPWKLFWRE